MGIQKAKKWVEMPFGTQNFPPGMGKADAAYGNQILQLYQSYSGALPVMEDKTVTITYADDAEQSTKNVSINASIFLSRE
jgi:hypothetical protein